MKKFLKRFAITILVLAVIAFGGTQLLYTILSADAPEVEHGDFENWEIHEENGVQYIGNNWFKKNKYGLFEAKITGKPYERGFLLSKLSQKLIINQEDIFVKQIDSLVPSKTWQFFLHKMIGVFNKDLDNNIPQEYLQEIYGMSRHASEDYDNIGDKYNRILNYHAAHDIGHTLQSYKMVGCTSFAAWDENTKDSSLVVGRNFDFYVGDDFSKEKEIIFYEPEAGIPFCIITWGGFTGCASGMNLEGLTVTINAATMTIPTHTATPIALVAREILQYASTIEEAYAIAKARKVFVSESLLISSSKDHSTAIIEKSPDTTDIFYPSSSKIICSNHNQSPAFVDSEDNRNNIKESSSMYRYNRVEELLQKHGKIDYTETAEILRNPFGKNDSLVGFGNELALNQLLAHHSVIFKPEQRLIWVSTSPFQLGEYLCYDLNKIFRSDWDIKKNNIVYEEQYTVPKSNILETDNWLNFVEYKKTRNVLKQNINSETEVTDLWIDNFIKLNPSYFDVYELSGDYYSENDQNKKAIQKYKQALLCAIPTKRERERIEEKLLSLKDED